MFLTHHKIKNFKYYSKDEVIAMVSKYNMLPENGSILSFNDRVNSYDDLIDNLFFIDKTGKKGRNRYGIKTVDAEKHQQKVLLKDPAWFY